MKKILILTWSYWHWHNAAAYNLKYWREQQGYEVKLIDMVEFAGIFAKGAQKFYAATSERAPYIWEKTFDLFDSHIARDLMFSIRPVVYQARFNNLLQVFRPDVVIVTFPFWLWFLWKYLKKQDKTFKVGVMVTDSITIHQTRYLNEQFVDRRFVIDKYSKHLFLQKFKVTEDKVVVSFFPLLPNKFKDKTAITWKNILMLLSYTLDEEYVRWVVELLQRIKWLNLTIIKGRAPEMFKELKEDFKNMNNINFVDFIPLVDEFWRKDWIYIGKPGGATMSEAIATDTPMIIPAYYPGQEQGNLKLLEMVEVGFYIPDPALTYTFVKYLDWNKILPNFRTVKKKNSLEIIHNALFWK